MKSIKQLGIFLFLFGFVNVLLGQVYQVDTLSDASPTFDANAAILRATNLPASEAKLARQFLQKVIQQFEAEKNWKAYIDANAELVKTYQWTEDFKKGIKLGETVFRKIKTQAPEFRKECGDLVYQTGLCFPYPYQYKTALKKFSDAKNLVKNHPTVDTLLLGKIYNSMGLSSIQLNDFKNAQLYLSNAKDLLENHSYFEECKYGWESYGGGSGMHIINVELDENGDTISYSAVSADPPSVGILVRCENYLESLGSVYTNLGEMYRLSGDMENSLKYLELGLEKILRAHLYPTQEQMLKIIPAYRTLGKYYYDLHEYEQSNFYFKKTVQLIKESQTQKSYFVHVVSPESFYLLSKNQFNIAIETNKYDINNYDEYSKVVHLLEQSLIPILEKWELELYNPNIDSSYFFYPKIFENKIKELKINIYTSAINYFLEDEDDETTLSILTFLDSTILEKQPLESFGDFDFQTKINYYQVKAEYLKKNNEIQKAIHLLKGNLQLIPSEALGYNNAFTNFKIAEYYQLLGQQDSALYYNHQALVAACDDFQNTNYIILPRLQHLKKNVPFMQKILLQKATLIEEFSKFAGDLKSRRQFLFLAISVIDLADEYHEQQLKKFNFLSTSRGKGFIQESVDIYLKGIAIAYKFHKTVYTDRSLDKAFYFIQKMKAQQLLLSTAENEAINLGTLSEDFLEEERKLKAIISESELSIFNTQQEASDTILIEEIIRDEERLFNTKRELEKLVKKMESSNPEYLANKNSVTPETYASIQELMDEDELIIEYVTHDKDLYIFSIDKNQPLQVIKTANQDSIYYHHTLSLNSLVSRSPMLRKSSRKKFIWHSYLLYQHYIAPIEQHLKNKKRIVIIGSGYINYIPFELLLPTNKVQRFKKLNYLIKDYEISYHYSTSLLAKAKRKTYQGDKSIYAFAPVYDDGSPEIASLDLSTIDDILNSQYRATDVNGKFLPLPISELEVKKIMELFQKKSPSSLNQLALRNEAQEDSLKINIEKQYQFIHIAGHSFANALFPKYSGIACYNTSYNNDDILFTNEIYNLRAKADLVTLSSCESGFGKFTEADGLLGLNRAFIYAGTPNVVYSLWKVYDKANAVLMIDFYNNILTGKNYSESLRSAKLKLLKKRATSSPHFWSPYLLIGR